MIFNVGLTKFLEEEASEGVKIPISKVLERAAKSMGISKRTISNVRKEGNDIEANRACFLTPTKKWQCSKPIMEIDGFDAAAIRRCIYDFYKNERSVPSVSGLLQRLSETIGFGRGKTSLKEF